MLESAIPQHLRVPRSQPVKTPPDYAPPYPSYSARFPVSVKNLVMAVIGAQSTSSAQIDRATMSPLLALVEKTTDSKPSFWEMASVKDNAGAHNVAVIAYWPNKESYTKWCSASGFEEWWRNLAPGVGEIGWFREVFFPPVERFETVFSDNTVPEGAAHMRESVSGEIQEHVYWGSSRDRLPAAQTDALVGVEAQSGARTPSGTTPQSKTSGRVRVDGKQNLCVIRSGQDWSNTYPAERKLYLETMHPVLIKGMDFLRDHGEEVGCYSCRFMNVLDSTNLGTNTDRTFDLAFFDDLSSLEKWSREHQTHLNIFGGFLKYTKELDNNVSLRLFHEIMVLEADQQSFEYIGCHPGTGMLTTVQASSDV